MPPLRVILLLALLLEIPAWAGKDEPSGSSLTSAPILSFDPGPPPLTAVGCVWEMAQFRPWYWADFRAAWGRSLLHSSILGANSLEDIQRVLLNEPFRFPLEIEPLREWIRTLREDRFERPRLHYSWRGNRTLGDYVWVSPFDSPAMMVPIGEILLRGITHVERRLYRSVQAIRTYRNRWYDCVYYTITHPDGSKSYLLGSLVSVRDPKYDTDTVVETTPRHRQQFAVVSNGGGYAGTYFGFDEGVGVAPRSCNQDAQVRAAADKLIHFDRQAPRIGYYRINDDERALATSIVLE